MDDAVSLLVEVNRTATFYAGRGSQEEAQLLVASIRSALVSFLKSTPMEPGRLLALVDVTCVAALGPILTSGLFLSEQSTETMLGVHQAVLHAAWWPRNGVDIPGGDSNLWMCAQDVGGGMPFR
jgi:hypothetical protein